jgi:L-malate glycosyltransferase
MRVLMLANPDSVHTQKWVLGLAKRGVEILLFGMQTPLTTAYDGVPGVTVRTVGLPAWITRQGARSPAKALYITAVVGVRKIVRRFKPDLIHAHYLSSYGLLGALARVHPFLISVWGSDVFENPDRSRLHRGLVRFVLRSADRISATSHVMAKRTMTFTAKTVSVIPFGIDLCEFAPQVVSRPFPSPSLVIGTVKTLHPFYGIRYLIEAFALLRARHPDALLELLIVGGGPQQSELERLAETLGVADHTLFVGAVAASEVPRYHNMIDIFVALSTAESFGVAVIEAAACAKPVVVSDVGGLPEVVDHERTGIVVPARNAVAAADAIDRLIADADLRQRMGTEGRRKVESSYDLERNLDQMLALYDETAQVSRKSS